MILFINMYLFLQIFLKNTKNYCNKWKCIYHTKCSLFINLYAIITYIFFIFPYGMCIAVICV